MELAGAPGSGEEYVVAAPAGHKLPGIGQELFLLVLVAQKVLPGIVGELGNALEGTCCVQAEGLVLGHLAPAITLVLAKEKLGLLPGTWGRQQRCPQLVFQLGISRLGRLVIVIERVSKNGFPGQVQEGLEQFQVPGQSCCQTAAGPPLGFHRASGQVIAFAQKVEEIGLPQVAPKAPGFCLGKDPFPGLAELAFAGVFGGFGQLMDYWVKKQGTQYG